MRTNVVKGKKARELILEGINAVANAVKRTIGPHGRNAMLDMHGLLITNDGVSIAKEIRSDEPGVQKGIEFIQQVAREANGIAGDGTSTTVVLTQALAKAAFDALERDVSVTRLRRELKQASEEFLEALKGVRRPATKKELVKIATTSVESPEIGKMIADAVEAVGEHGTVSYEASEDKTVTSEVKSGYVLNAGYKNPHLVNTPKTVDYRDVDVLVWNTPLDNLAKLESIVAQLQESGANRLVVVCSSVEDSVMSLIIENHVTDTFHIVPVPIHSFLGDVMEDIAVYTGAKYLHSSQTPSVSDLGFAETFTQNAVETVITMDEGNGVRETNANEVEDRIEALKALDLKGKERIEVERRIGRLSGSVAVIRVGADSKQEQDYLMKKVEDAINATKSAKDGVVAGAGCAYLHALNLLPVEFPTVKGGQILMESVYAPIRNILRNGDVDFADVRSEVLWKNKTYNAMTGKFDDSVIDSYLTVETALRTAVSAVSTLLTIDSLVLNIKK